MAGRLKDKPIPRGRVFTVEEQLSMGDGANRMRFVLNMTPNSHGNLVRRPSIRAVDIGFGGNEWSTSYVSATSDSSGHQIGDYDGTSPATPAYSFNGQDYTNSQTAVTPVVANRILEGIDCEIIHGRLVCVYLIKKSNSTAVQLSWSWHWPTDLMLGYASTQWAPATTESDVSLVTGAEYTGLHTYVAAKYWDRRIVNLRDHFVICGYGVGGNRVAGMAADGTVENDSIPIMESQKLMMDTVPTDLTYRGGTSIVHADSSSTAYVKHGPKECFAHLDRHAQTVWYGFHNTPYMFDGIASNEHLIPMLAEQDIATSGVVMRPFVVQFAEAMRPSSMHALGATQLTGSASALNEEVVGMAEFGEGTLMFTHTGQYFVSGAAGFAGQGKMEIVSSTIGSDSRHSIKAIGQGVMFANHSGLYMNSMQSGVSRLRAFDELFNDGVSIDKGPYSYYQGDADNEADDQTEIKKLETHDCTPWGYYKIDTGRLDRAVGAVWDDLYILFCSLTTHDPADDNRFALVLNTKTGAATTWLFPKNMGVRGFAYVSGPDAHPYVMTRYGLATLEDHMSADLVWKTTGSGASLTTTTDNDEPYPCAFAQSQWVPVTGESTSMPAVNVIHEMPTDESVDIDMNMRVQAWSQVADLNAAQATIDRSQFMTNDVGTLDDLYKGTLSSWYKNATGSGGSYAYYSKADGSPGTEIVDGQTEALTATRYAAGPPLRSTTIKCHANALAHRFQFHTLNQITIRNIDFQAKALSKRGSRG